MSSGIYLHIPFCRSRCSYCDFATDVYKSAEIVESYVSAIAKEIENFPASPAADTIYFGGGTPSLLTAEQVEKILREINSKFEVTSDAEITMEMNPATVDAEKLHAYKSLGINRASFGVQTFNDRDLKLLARGHDANDARETFRLLRETGFDNVSFDLIAGLPDQTMDDWQRNLDEAITMSPEHISLYLLEIHEGTPLAEQLRSGRRKSIDDEVAAEMYNVMLARLAAAGYEQYEISNFSRPGFESRHNTKYWRLDPVYGFGISAHSFDGRERYANTRDTAAYVDSIRESGSAEISRETINAESEFIFLGLRLTRGINLAVFETRFGNDLPSTYRAELDRLTNAELVEISDGHLKLTGKGMLFSNEVFAEFV